MISGACFCKTVQYELLTESQMQGLCYCTGAVTQPLHLRFGQQLVLHGFAKTGARNHSYLLLLLLGFTYWFSTRSCHTSPATGY